MLVLRIFRSIILSLCTSCSSIIMCRFVCLMIRRPPRSTRTDTLVPYTTLFRSGDLPQQGADLMPRTAVCVDIVQNAGAEVRVDTPTRASAWGFTIKSAKEMAADRFPDHVAPSFLFRMAQSENLLPFVLCVHRAPLPLPPSTGERRVGTVCVRESRTRW